MTTKGVALVKRMSVDLCGKGKALPIELVACCAVNAIICAAKNICSALLLQCFLAVDAIIKREKKR